MPKLRTKHPASTGYRRSTVDPRTAPQFTLHSDTLRIIHRCNEADRSSALVKVRVLSRIDTGADEN
jgi:hypothetical protein